MDMSSLMEEDERESFSDKIPRGQRQPHHHNSWSSPMAPQNSAKQVSPGFVSGVSSHDSPFDSKLPNERAEIQHYTDSSEASSLRRKEKSSTVVNDTSEINPVLPNDNNHFRRSGNAKEFKTTATTIFGTRSYENPPVADEKDGIFLTDKSSSITLLLVKRMPERTTTMS